MSANVSCIGETIRTPVNISSTKNQNNLEIFTFKFYSFKVLSSNAIFSSTYKTVDCSFFAMDDFAILLMKVVVTFWNQHNS